MDLGDLEEIIEAEPEASPEPLPIEADPDVVSEPRYEPSSPVEARPEKVGTPA